MVNHIKSTFLAYRDLDPEALKSYLRKKFKCSKYKAEKTIKILFES